MDKQEVLAATGETAKKQLTLPLVCGWCKRVSVTPDPIGKGWVCNDTTGLVVCVSCINKEIGF